MFDSLDGGAPIEKYIVQMKEKGTRNWNDVATTPGKTTKAKVTAVDEGREYEFRIVAVNVRVLDGIPNSFYIIFFLLQKAGPSEPSDSSRTGN